MANINLRQCKETFTEQHGRPARPTEALIFNQLTCALAWIHAPRQGRVRKYGEYTEDDCRNRMA